jgi:hypothetical protein
MTHGHAERTLAAIRLLEAETGNCSPAWTTLNPSMCIGCAMPPTQPRGVCVLPAPQRSLTTRCQRPDSPVGRMSRADEARALKVAVSR